MNDSKSFYDEFDKDCEWYCDNCGAFMNSQPGFTTENGKWECYECGYVNDVSVNNIIYDLSAETGFEDASEKYNFFDDADIQEENLSVYDAAEIYFSSGRDESKMFGYSEEELIEAFNK